ncbi:GNAT family N-acetyltransferase [Pedobacter sp. PLR]|uniref:GNAT family N-acetyltransferase n=1 Tax=Pedobacter sp. PLR TaxID=2994465 RepID=UPI0022469B0C|nr:GNAT family N-acetyltransferase [Pedobacter sp. PLR]MCX2452206.1 GNAT family N-acetyltransferase [Pedobacter sp. PLR]
MKRLIQLFEKEDWKYYVGNSLQHDFYHSWHYHSMELAAEPLLFVYEEGENYLALPLIKREIPGEEYSDLTSVYGYTGPISNQKFCTLSTLFLENFRLSFLEYLKEEKIVSVFSRLHPFFDQSLPISKLGGIHANGKTVAIDLTLSIQDQRKKYHSRLRSNISQLRRKGYIVRESDSIADIDIFAQLYMEHMKRISPSGSHLFPRSYFRDLYYSDELNCKLLLVYLGDQAVSAAYVVCSNEIIQAHLLGTLTAYLPDSPAKLLTDEISVIGRKMGARYFHLGSGLNFKEDALFEWKAAFSDLILDFNSWRYIANPEVYHVLVQKLEINKAADLDFFPLYRYNSS